MSAGHTPGPWSWQGEDYRGGWGWQMLVGPNGEGLIVGQGADGRASEHLRAHMPVDPALCVTGMLADGKPHVEPVHVFGEANARLIVTAPDVAKEAAFLCARLREFERELSEPAYREYHGHVAPSIARLESLLA